MPFCKEGQLPRGNYFTCRPRAGYALFPESLSWNDLTIAMKWMIFLQIAGEFCVLLCSGR